MRFFGRPAAVVLATTAALALSSCDSTGDSVTGAAGVTTGGSQPTGAGAAEAGEADETGDVGDPGEAPESDAPSGRADPAVQDAVSALGTLEVKGRAPKTGYSRDQFGQRWKDTDRNGCDQRNDVLARDMVEVRRDGPCTVLAGTLDDPYTATTINFVRGQDTSTAVHIDHVVAMSDAWQKGAQQLTPERREEFANDHLNLLAVDGPANMQKGDGDAATWLPSNRPFRCSYVATQVQVKAKYGLWVTAAERDAIARELEKCGADGIAPVDEVPHPAPEVEPEPAPAQPAVPAAPAGEPGGESAGEVY